MFRNLLADFPNLITGLGYRRTSLETTDYNCVAWAFEDQSRWWEPDQFNICYWPDDVKRAYDIKCYVKLCEKFGYVECGDANPEAGFEKLAVYTNGDRFSHITRQLPDGQWTSKLGIGDDISHSLDGLVSTRYGTHTKYFKRAINSSASPNTS